MLSNVDINPNFIFVKLTLITINKLSISSILHFLKKKKTLIEQSIQTVTTLLAKVIMGE